VARRDARLPRVPALAPRRLVLIQVAFVRLHTRQLPGARRAEALLRAAVAFHLGHGVTTSKGIPERQVYRTRGAEAASSVGSCARRDAAPRSTPARGWPRVATLVGAPPDERVSVRVRQVRPPGVAPARRPHAERPLRQLARGVAQPAWAGRGVGPV